MVPRDLDPVAGDFHDATHAWVLEVPAGESTASHQTVIVASTSDAGAHWVSTSALGVDGQATHIQFTDHAHGWVFATASAGGALGAGDTTLYRTVDGGAHWDAVKPPSQVRQGSGVQGSLPEACSGGGPIGPPSFIDAHTGWLGAFCTRMFYYVTHDGGLTWAPQALPAFPGPPATHGTGGPLYDVDPADVLTSNDAFIVAHRGYTTGANALQDAALYTTSDAGASWDAVRLPAAEFTAAFSDPQHGWMLADGAGGDTGTQYLYRTTDGGLTWSQLLGPRSDYPRELSFVDSRTGFVLLHVPGDESGKLLETVDGGTTLSEVATAFP